MTPALTSAVILTTLFGLYFVAQGLHLRPAYVPVATDRTLKIAAALLLITTGLL